MMKEIDEILKHAPEIGLFLSVALGYLVGKIRFGSFTLGTTAGALIIGICIGIAFPGVTVNPLVKAVFFAMFIYAVGFKTGPQFFHSLNRSMLSQVALAIVITVSGLFTVLACAKIMKLDEGSAAGLAAGGLTQSAIIGTAGDAISQLGLSADKTKELQANVAVGYAITYIFGTIGVIFFARDIVPRILKVNLKTGSEELETKLSGGRKPLKPGEFNVNLDRTVRGYVVSSQNEAKTIQALKLAFAGRCSVVKLVRKGQEVPIDLSAPLQTDDILLVAGSSHELIRGQEIIGSEVDISDWNLAGLAGEVVVVKKDIIGKRLDEIDIGQNHAVFLKSISRGGTEIPINPGLILRRGDSLTLVGKSEDVKYAAAMAGALHLPTVKTDLFYCGLGIAVGTLIGLFSVNVAGIPVTLGAGGGVLVAGLVFGYLRSLQPTFGNFPASVQTVFSDLGLAGFVACVGLAAGPEAWNAIKTSGVGLLIAGVFATIVPLIIGLVAGMLMRMQPIILIGAICGSRSNNASIGAVTDEADSAAAALGFTVTYAIANVLLTVWGPIVVGVVHKWLAVSGTG